MAIQETRYKIVTNLDYPYHSNNDVIKYQEIELKESQIIPYIQALLSTNEVLQIHILMQQRNR